MWLCVNVYTVCVCMSVVVWMKVVRYCFTLAGCQNPPLPVVDPGRLNERKPLTSSLTEDVCVYACIFVLAYTQADANEDVRRLYNRADVCILIRLAAAHCGAVIH